MDVSIILRDRGSSWPTIELSCLLLSQYFLNTLINSASTRSMKMIELNKKQIDNQCIKFELY